MGRLFFLTLATIIVLTAGPRAHADDQCGDVITWNKTLVDTATIKDERLVRLFDEVWTLTGMPANVKPGLCEDVDEWQPIAPFTTPPDEHGHSVVVLPSYVVPASNEILRAVFGHEMGHIKQGVANWPHAQNGVLSFEMAADELATQWVGKDAVRAMLTTFLKWVEFTHDPEIIEPLKERLKILAQ